MTGNAPVPSPPSCRRCRTPKADCDAARAAAASPDPNRPMLRQVPARRPAATAAGMTRLILCGDCSAAWKRCGATFYGGGWETQLCADALGVPSLMSLSAEYAFRAFHDVPDADPAGYRERFGYVPPDALVSTVAANTRTPVSVSASNRGGDYQ